MKKYILILASALLAQLSWAETSVLFHPNGKTLETIVDHFAKAQARIDIAMYNMDATGNGPLVQWLNSEDVKGRMAKGELSVRLLLNGSPSDSKKSGKMTALEATGADVRWLSTSRELHHKFAVIDAGLKHSQVISGSANWSELSRTSYTENIFYVEDEAEFSQLYQNQFNFLWSIADEFGNIGRNQDISQTPATGRGEITAFFNVPDASWIQRGESKNLSADDFLLTNEFVKAIDHAKSSIKMATTRFRLAPIYEAVSRAASRGVKVQLILTQAEYLPSFLREKNKDPDCADMYSRSCSLNTNFAIPLMKQPGVEVRAKQFSLRRSDGIMQQMHSKYLIVDNSVVLSGSFNLSIASEFSNFENLAKFSGRSQTQVIDAFVKNFSGLWELNRDSYPTFMEELESHLKMGQNVPCLFPAMVLTFEETDAIIDMGKRYKSRLDKICK